LVYIYIHQITRRYILAKWDIIKLYRILVMVYRVTYDIFWTLAIIPRCQSCNESENGSFSVGWCKMLKRRPTLMDR
jgi:hypothetical protein